MRKQYDYILRIHYAGMWHAVSVVFLIVVATVHKLRILQQTNRRYGSSPYAVVCLLESGEIRGNMLTRRFAFAPPCGAAAPISDEWRKTLDLFWNFRTAFLPFVPEKWSFRSLRPKNGKFLPI